MNYIEIKTGAVISHVELAARHPAVCLPETPDLPWLTMQGLAPLREPPAPDSAPFGHEVARKPPAPVSNGWWEAGWQFVPLPREKVLEAVCARINAWRSEQERGGFWWNGCLWDSDPVSVQRITSIGAAGLAPPSGYWTNAHNEDIPVDLDGMRALYLAMLQRGSEIHDRQREMKQALAALSFDELLAFQPGWEDAAA
ncbi:MAG: DUF4376 domain-containing protein [Laribacter sp.]|nr:DUF4376 domain-containing protein [Laribacter sp.]MBP9608535.1 DUF4376 domain-containing protein [Laribacter sp.]